MMPETNLGGGLASPSAHWQVTDLFQVYLLTGHVESNTYFGSSRALGNLYRWTHAQPGDTIHALAGGIFLVDAGGIEVYVVTLKLSDKHPFEKVYVPPRHDWPLDKLTSVETPWPRIPQPDLPTYTMVQAKELGAVTFGRGIDWYLED